MTEFRIGSAKQQKVSENRVRRNLRTVRETDDISHLYFFSIEFTDRILDDCRKLMVRDGRKFLSIKLLSCTGKTPDAVTMIMDYSAAQSLTVSNCELPTLHAVNEALRTNTSLRVLRISASTMIEGTDCLDGLVYNRTLRELGLCGSHLSQCAVDCLSQALARNSGLRTLKLDDCDLEDHAMASVLGSVLEHGTLTDLNLSNNAASSEALEMIAALVRRNRQLRNLSIQSLRFSDGLDPSVLSRAIEALRSNGTLESLDVSGNHFTNEAVLGICECLSENRSLTKLDISDAGIDEAGIELFARYLPRFRAIEVLDLSENDFTEAGARSLANGLRNNRLVQSLGSIEKGFECYHRIEHFLDLNMAGRRAFQNDVSLSVWSHLLARTARADLSCGRNENALFSLLRGPALFER